MKRKFQPSEYESYWLFKENLETRLWTTEAQESVDSVERFREELNLDHEEEPE